MKKPFAQTLALSRTQLILGLALFLAVAAVLQLLWGGIVRGRNPLIGGGLSVPGKVQVPKLPSPEVFMQPEKLPPLVLSNFFHSAFIDRALLKIAEQKATQEAQKLALIINALEAKRVSTVTPSLMGGEGGACKAKPIPPPVRFCFQGLIQTADGRVVALLNATPDGRSAPFVEGEKCSGAVITNLMAERLELILNDGSVRGVARGIPESIPEDLLHEH